MKERAIAAFFALLLVLPLLFYGGVLGILILTGVACVIGTGELWNMFSNERSLPRTVLFVLYSVYLTVFGVLTIDALNGVPLQFVSIDLMVVLVPSVFVLWLSALFLIPDNKEGMTFAGNATFGLIYLPVLLSTFVELRAINDDGLLWVVLAMILTWSADTGAYFAGRSFGKNKLFPRVSPKKTIEGVYGGVMLAIVVAVAYTSTWLPNVDIVSAGLMGAVLAVLSVVGDLVESMMKRAFGVKDSGKLMPGHGGIIDRLDSLLFTFPVMLIYVTYFV